MEETPTRFVAASPSVIESMISQRLEELRAARQTLDGLASRYRAASLARAADGVFEIIRGEDALRHSSLNLLRSARSEVLNLVKPPLIAVRPEERIGPAEAVRNRIVYETARSSSRGRSRRSGRACSTATSEGPRAAPDQDARGRRLGRAAAARAARHHPDRGARARERRARWGAGAVRVRLDDRDSTPLYDGNGDAHTSTVSPTRTASSCRCCSRA